MGRGGEGKTLRAGGRPRAAGVRQALPDVPAPGGVRCRAGADRRAAGSPRRELDSVPLWRSSRFTVTIHWSGNRKKGEAARKVRIRTCGRHRPRPLAGRRASQAGWGAYRSRGVVRIIGPPSTHLDSAPNGPTSPRSFPAMQKTSRGASCSWLTVPLHELSQLRSALWNSCEDRIDIVMQFSLCCMTGKETPWRNRR